MCKAVSLTSGSKAKLLCGLRSGVVSPSPTPSTTSSTTASPRVVRKAHLKKNLRRKIDTSPAQAVSLEVFLEGKALCAALVRACNGMHDVLSNMPGSMFVDAPRKSLGAHLQTLRKKFKCLDACLVSAMIYLDRLSKLHPGMLHQTNIHRFLSVSLMVSVKFHDDDFYTNTYYAKSSGLTLTEMNAMEVQFLSLLKYKLDVSPEEYASYIQILQQCSSRKIALAGA